MQSVDEWPDGWSDPRRCRGRSWQPDEEPLQTGEDLRERPRRQENDDQGEENTSLPFARWQLRR